MKHLAALAFLLAVLASPAMSAERPNFILFITDDISQEDLGCYGHPVAKTPQLDRMAAAGARFNNAYLTCSSCSPSRCSLITGRFPHNTGASELHTQLPEGHFLWPQALKDAGYYTVLSGKHHMGPNADPAFVEVLGGKGPGKEEDWVELLQKRPRDRPFFCWFASSDAHRGWTIDEYAPKYDADEIPVPPYLVDGEATRQDLADYMHEVSRTDTFAGRLREELERQEIADNTYIIYMADNGRPFPRCKTRVYDSGVKSPFIVYCPGRVQPNVSDALINVNVDVGPTILELAGVPSSERMQGVSFAGLLDGSKAKSRDYVFSEHNWHVHQANERMVRHGNFVYIRNAYPELQLWCSEASPKFPSGKELWELEKAGKLKPEQRDIFLKPRPAEELFDVSSDPHQLTNLAGRSEHTTRLNQLRLVLDRWTSATHDSISSDPTRDRDTLEGKKSRKWSHRIQPGVENGSVETNDAGPVMAVTGDSTL